MKTFEDERGIIEDLKVGKDWSVTYISFKKGAVRGNHFHKETRQFDQLLSGRLLVVHENGNDKMQKEIVAGEIVGHFPNDKHAYKALEDSEMISMCFGKRVGENYEEDTFRLLESEKLL